MGGCETHSAGPAHAPGDHHQTPSPRNPNPRLFLAPDHRPPLTGLKLVRPRPRPDALRCGRSSLTHGRATAQTGSCEESQGTVLPPARRPTQVTGPAHHALLTEGPPWVDDLRHAHPDRPRVSACRCCRGHGRPEVRGCEFAGGGPPGETQGLVRHLVRRRRAGRHPEVGAGQLSRRRWPARVRSAGRAGRGGSGEGDAQAVRAARRRVYGAAVRGGDLGGDGQPEAGAGAAGPGSGAVEALEDAGESGLAGCRGRRR